MLSRSDFVGEWGRAIRPEWFEGKELQNIVVSILQFYRQYHNTPSYTDLRIYIKKMVASNDKEYENYARFLKLIRQTSKSGDMVFVYDHFKEFVKYSAYRHATLASARALQDGKWDLIPEIVRVAQKTTTESYKSLVYFKDVYERVSTALLRDTIRTGIDELDGWMNGGTARRELTAVLASTGTGKSLFLVNLGAAAVLQGLSVVHLPTEESNLMTAARYDRRFTHRSEKTLLKDAKASAKKLERIYERGGNLLLTNCLGWDVYALRNFIYEQDRCPDMVIVDYADKLLSPRSYSQRRFELEAIYTELLAMSDEFNCSLITASQAKALAKHSVKLYAEDMGEAYLKANVAHNILGLCQTEAEEDAGNMRIYIAKARFTPSHKEIECKIIHEQAWIMSTSQYMKMTTEDI